MKDKVPDEYLLKLNMPQDLTDEERQLWMLEETMWSSSYGDYIWNISRNRIARNVMIHKLEDMLDVLHPPEKSKEGDTFPFYVLPWKKHQVVGVPQGSSFVMHMSIPHTDDILLFRNPTDEERGNLIEKYGRALEMLQRTNDKYPVAKDFTKAERRLNETLCHQWFLDWKEHEEDLIEIIEEEGDERECASEELPF